MISRRVPPCSARESRASASSIGDARDKFTHAIGCHRPVGSEARHVVAQNLANQPSARILIETEVHGRVDLFEFIPFNHEREVANVR